MIKVFIVDDHKILVQALADFLGTQPNIQLLGMAHSCREALKQAPAAEPEVILLDIGMPEMNGIDCCRELMKINDQFKVIGLSTHMEISVVKSLFKAGAKGYVSKAADLRELPRAIEKVHRGERFIGEVAREAFMADISSETSRQSQATSLLPRLTPRELEVLELIAQEYTTEEIGKTLFISSNTVQTHRKNLISKFGVRNSVGLVLKALELKII